MQIILEKSWKKAFKNEFNKPYFEKLASSVSEAYCGDELVFPPKELIFNALNLCPLDDLKVVILGQDPYHGAHQAHGLCFSVQEGTKVPPSLQNIYKELQNDLGIPIRTIGDLSSWARQGALLLNATLTVLNGKPGSHQGLGWEQFTNAVIKKISDEKKHIVFLLWGKYAQDKEKFINAQKHLILTAPHPSPFSAYTGFFGCKHFSKANEYLKKHGRQPIEW
ncbi:MAG: uracil-DNA glycosylase [Candidatus Pacebacteria bacterium]|nr:uracil-DNA glycosylase [Candidatus Paceibacterota bacterium]MCF7857116.1 uracil-DNA glycosylase [Candidatus Paceibacterota bacterium]